MQNAHTSEMAWAFSAFPDAGKTQKALGESQQTLCQAAPL